VLAAQEAQQPDLALIGGAEVGVPAFGRRGLNRPPSQQSKACPSPVPAAMTARWPGVAMPALSVSSSSGSTNSAP
jgi:hypothetical protein